MPFSSESSVSPALKPEFSNFKIVLPVSHLLEDYSLKIFELKFREVYLDIEETKWQAVQ